MTQHVLLGSGVAVRHRRRYLLPPTDVLIRTGEVHAVVGEPGASHAALALVLAGRMTVDEGEATMDGSALEINRRHAVALVDVPGVTEPDDVVPVGTVLGEELAMARLPAQRRAVRAWAPTVDLGERFEDLPAERRVELLLRAAALRPRVRFLILTLPDRWGAPPAAWTPVAHELAGHGLGVLVTIAPTSASLLDVPSTLIGGAR